jgi:hypothetical protein
VTTPTTVKVQLKLRQDLAATWTSVNPTLLAGELGRESDTGKTKIGDGTTPWTSLAYERLGGLITDADIAANAEIAVSKLANGAANQALVSDGTDVSWSDDLTLAGALRLADADGSNWVAFQGADTIAANVAWTLPDADGTADQVLKTDGSGVLGWASPSVSGPILENQQTISEDYTLTSGYNGVSAGPIEVAAGFSVTVPANATWMVLS